MMFVYKIMMCEVNKTFTSEKRAEALSENSIRLGAGHGVFRESLEFCQSLVIALVGGR